MFAILHLLGTVVANLFKSRQRLEAENLFLRRQLNIVLRRAPHRPRLRGSAGSVGMADMALAKPDRIGRRGWARHHHAVASSGVSGLLALEISRSKALPSVNADHYLNALLERYCNDALY